MLKSKKIDLGLIKDFAIMRKKLNDKKFFDKYNIFKLKNYSQKEQKNNGFYARGFERGFDDAPKILKKLGKYKLKEVDNFWKILNHIQKDKKQIINDYVNMPFAKQHQDFREDNIIITKNNKQMLIDWGSSYGYHPFMSDIAPFVVNNPKALNTYLKNSGLKEVSKEQIKRWVYVSLAQQFLGIIKWRLHPNEKRADTKEHCKRYLGYEYKTYKELMR